MSTFRILVADDHPIFRYGVCALLGSHEGWEICGEAGDGRDAVEKCKLLKPDLLILDICMPNLNGVDAARNILREEPTQRIMVLTNVESEQVIQDCLEAGVRGWVLKSDAVQDLMSAAEAMQHRKSVFSPRVAELILDGYLQRHRVTPVASKVPKLSTREREVVQLLGEGKSSKDVAVMLNISVKTAETHRSNIMMKLKLHSIAELVLYAVRNEIVHVHLPTVTRLGGPATNGRGSLGLQSLS